MTLSSDLAASIQHRWSTTYSIQPSHMICCRIRHMHLRSYEYRIPLSVTLKVGQGFGYSLDGLRSLRRRWRSRKKRFLVLSIYSLMALLSPTTVDLWLYRLCWIAVRAGVYG